MNRFFIVTIHTDTDDDFFFDGCITELRLDEEKHWYTGNFATLEEAIAVCKKQYQHMIDTLRVASKGSKESQRWFRKRIRYHFIKIIKKLDVLDTLDENDTKHCLIWHECNQDGWCEIELYTTKQLLNDCKEKLKSLNKKIQSTGYHCVMKKQKRSNKQ